VQTFEVVGTPLSFDYFFMRRVRHSTSLKRLWFGVVVCCGRIGFSNAVEEFDVGDGDFCSSELLEAEQTFAIIDPEYRSEKLCLRIVKFKHGPCSSANPDKSARQ
jgi:hypothetical protein